ncbi:MAG: PAS domain S-box protein [Marinoscillum sp.]
MTTSFLDAKKITLSVIRSTLVGANNADSVLIYNLKQSDVFSLNDFINELTPLRVGQELEEGIVVLLDETTTFNFDGHRLSISLQRDSSSTLGNIFDEEEIRTKESEAHYKYLFEISGELICTHEPSGIYKYVSPSSLSILGYRPEELKGTDPYDYFHPDDIDRIRQSSHEQILEGNKPSNVQYRYRRKDGKYIWLDTYTHSVTNSSGRVTSLISGSREVSELKEVEIRLRQSEERFRGIANNFPGVIYLCLNDEKYSMLYLNEAVEELTGHTWEDFVHGKVSFVDLYHPDDASYIFDAVDTALEQQKPFHVTYRIKNKIRDEWVWVDEYGQGIYDGESLESIEGILLDITGRRQAEQRMRESEANLKSLVESTNSLIGLFDKELNLLEFNTSFKNYVLASNGIELESGAKLQDFIRPEFINQYTESMLIALNGKKIAKTAEYPIGGEVLYFQARYNPIYNNKEITGVSLFIEDVTELRRSQEELEKYAEKLESLVEERTRELQVKNEELSTSNEELAVALDDLKNTQAKLVQTEKMASLGVLAAGIGHEINNPLNFIQNGSSGLKRELLDSNELNWVEIDPFFEIIEEGVTRAGNIVKSLSHFSRQVKTMDELCNVHEVVDNCLVILNANLKGRVNVEKEYSNQPPIIKGNEGKLHQVFLNILKNAEQAIEVDGMIKIKTSISDDSIGIEISDNGVGIPEEDLSKIGDPFFTTKPPGLGTGLGLFITYSLIEELNGEVQVESGTKKGTKFMITFPIS